MPAALLREHADVEFHFDLMDCHIDVCSPEVLGLFTTHFDFQGAAAFCAFHSQMQNRQDNSGSAINRDVHCLFARKISAGRFAVLFSTSHIPTP